MTDDPEGDAPGGDADRGGRAESDASTDRSLRTRVVAQFSGAGDRAAVWRALDRVLPTDRYLNLGYSPWYLPAVVGDSQARLAGRLAEGLAERVDPAAARLLDVGCGRGGPAGQFADRGFAVTGLDLVPYNVSLARANAPGTFVVGDASALPFADGVFDACASVDALVYVADDAAALAEAARVLAPGGWLAVSDLLAAPDPPADGTGVLTDFVDAWDLAPLVTPEERRRDLRAAGFTLDATVDVTANSVGRFRRWSGPFLALADGPTGGTLRALLGRWGVDPDAAVAQVRAAHRALPSLRHEVVYARR